MYLIKGLAEGRGNTGGSESERYLRDSLFLSTTLNSDLLVPGIGIPFLVPSLLVHPRPTLTLSGLTQMSPPPLELSAPALQAYTSICVSMALHTFFI